MTSVADLAEARRQQKRKRMDGHASADDGDGSDGARRVIQIQAAEQARAVDETEAALIEAGSPVFVRAGRLVQRSDVPPCRRARGRRGSP